MWKLISVKGKWCHSNAPNPYQWRIDEIERNLWKTTENCGAIERRKRAAKARRWSLFRTPLPLPHPSLHSTRANNKKASRICSIHRSGWAFVSPGDLRDDSEWFSLTTEQRRWENKTETRQRGNVSLRGREIIIIIRIKDFCCVVKRYVHSGWVKRTGNIEFCAISCFEVSGTMRNDNDKNSLLHRKKVRRQKLILCKSIKYWVIFECLVEWFSVLENTFCNEKFSYLNTSEFVKKKMLNSRSLFFNRVRRKNSTI